MKKTFLCAVLATMMMTGCGTGNSTIDQMGSAVLNDIVAKGSNSATSSSTTTTTVGNILQSVLGTSTMTQQNLIGTWTYSQPGCAFTSEKLLAQAGGEVVAGQIKSKLLPVYQKVGIKSGNTTVTFKSDNTFTAQIAGKSWSGTYTFDQSTGKVTMTGLLLNVNCYVKRNSDGIGLLFEAKKLLTLLQTMSALSGNSSLQTIGDLASNYDGLRLGFDMK